MQRGQPHSHSPSPGVRHPAPPAPLPAARRLQPWRARPLRVWVGSTTPITIDFNPFHVDTTLFGTYGPIYEPLFFFNQLSADPPTPMIGESYAYSTDGKEVTIKLKAGLKWNDGQPLTADDVVFTLGYGRNNTDHLLKATKGQLQDRTHDLATARHFSDEIMVMLRGEIVERGPADEVILDPQHPYTASLREAAADPERLGRLRDEVRAEHAGRPR